MIFLYINGLERTSDLKYNSLNIDNQIQQRSDSCDFKLNDGAAPPSENQDMQIFKGDEIAAAAGATITLNGNYEKKVRLFYVGQKLHIRIGDVDEEIVTVQSYDEDSLQIILEAAPSGVVSIGDKIGDKVFGGVVSRVEDFNIEVLANLEFAIEGVDYTKIFDKKNISDTWEDVDSRYIINDFVNTTVNLNQTIDDLSYENSTALSAEWIESGDGDNPIVDSALFLEGTSSAIFPWTNAGGVATFSATPTSRDLSALIGVASGTPVSGSLMMWIQTTDQADITSIKVRIGSDASNYAEVTLDTPTGSDFEYKTARLGSATMVGSPDWNNSDYIAIIVDEIGNGQIKTNGVRVNADNSFTLFNVEPTPAFDDLRSPQLKPTGLMQQLAKTWDFIWYIDYNRDIVFRSSDATAAPFSLTDTSANFDGLRTKIDQSQLGNRIIIRGGEKTSDSTYSQAFPGDGVKREWILKNKFKNLVIKIDNKSDTHAAEAGTSTTNIKVTGHGLVTGDYVTNQSRNSEVREITKVDNDNFTVEAIFSQTTGDNITFFTIIKTDGIEGLIDETTVDYVYNSNEKSVRSTGSETTLNIGDGILFTYNERLSIQIQYIDPASANALKALGLGDGIFDLDPYTDRNIEDIGTALSIAQAKVFLYSNPIITGRFKTDQHGLRAGQVIQIQDSVRGINTSYVIQKISSRSKGGQFSDYFEYRVTFGTTLFGIIEFFQKLLSTQDKIELNTEDIVETFISSSEIVEHSDVNSATLSGGDKRATITETIKHSDVNQVVGFPTGTWRWEPNGVGQALETRWSLFDWG